MFEMATNGHIATIGKVSNPSCHPTYPICYVGRLMTSQDVLPGKYLSEQDRVYAALDDTEVFVGTMQLLDVLPGCPVTWMPFSAGEALPSGAVKGGFLASNGASLYVMRASANVYTVLGYYDPSAGAGYMPHYGVVTKTEMELLVLL